MKRQSKAEEALRAHIRVIEGEITGYKTIVMELQAKITALADIKYKAESEVARLEKIRRTASESRKP